MKLCWALSGQMKSHRKLNLPHYHLLAHLWKTFTLNNSCECGELGVQIQQCPGGLISLPFNKLKIRKAIQTFSLLFGFIRSCFWFLFLLLLFLALLQEWRCAELLFLFLGGLGLALRGLRLSRLFLRCYGDFHRFWSAHAQPGYLDAQILLHLCQVVFPVGYCVCHEMKPTERDANKNTLNDPFHLRHFLSFSTNWKHPFTC